MSKRETALTALHKALQEAFDLHTPEVRVLRNEAVPQRLPRGGLVQLSDGETLVDAVVMSPLAQHVDQRVDCTLIAPSDADLDAMLTRLHDTVVADRTLGNAVDWVSVESVEIETVERDDSAPLRAARVELSVWFVTEGSPLA